MDGVCSYITFERGIGSLWSPIPDGAYRGGVESVKSPLTKEKTLASIQGLACEMLVSGCGDCVTPAPAVPPAPHPTGSARFEEWSAGGRLPAA